MPSSDTARILARRLAKARAEEAKWKAEKEALERAIEAMGTVVGALVEQERKTGAQRRSDVARNMGLPPDVDSATLATRMEEQTRGTRVSRARLDRANRKHPFVAALVKEGLTVTAIAAELGYSRSTVQSWYDSDSGNGRPIPRAAAEAIQKRLKVPLTAWRKLVD